MRITVECSTLDVKAINERQRLVTSSHSLMRCRFPSFFVHRPSLFFAPDIRQKEDTTIRFVSRAALQLKTNSVEVSLFQPLQPLRCER